MNLEPDKPMFVVELIFALVVSLLCAAMLLPVTARTGWRVRHPSIEPLSVFALLLILFLSTWAGGIWLVPVGPKLWGVAWGGFVVVGLFVALLIGAVSRVDRRLNVPYGSRPRGPETSMMALALLILLILAVVVGYARLR